MKNNTIRPSLRSREIKYAVRDIVLLAEQAKAKGKTLLNLNIGDPLLFDFRTPEHMIVAVEKAMRAQHNGYSSSSGIGEAIEAITVSAKGKGIDNIAEVFVTTGGSEAIEIAIAALVDPGDNVLTPAPGYPLYTAVLPKLSAIARPYYLDEDNGWEPSLADIEAKIDRRTRAIVLINPNNPTGAVYSRELLLSIIDLARKHRLVILADEIYDQMVYDERALHISIASLADDVVFVTFNGLSKCYLAPGFRIGWGIISGDKTLLSPYAEAVLKFTRARLCASHPMQYCIAPALLGDQSHIDVVCEKLRCRRDITVSMLNAIEGISCVAPTATFYAYPKIDLGISDDEFVRRVIMETGVVIVPGSGFGQKPGTEHFRVVFLPEDEILRRAFQAIAAVAQTFRS